MSVSWTNVISETNRLWGMVVLFYSVFTKGKQFGAVQVLYCTVEKVDM